MAVSPSSLQSPSALTSLISPSTATASPDPIRALSLQILHNLEHQHLWTSLRIHDPYTLSPEQQSPLISGVPPHNIYTHPDEQNFMLEHGITPESVPVGKEWVLPSVQGQSWSLRKLAGLFDSLPTRTDDMFDNEETEQNITETKMIELIKRKKEGIWGGKRALLAVVNRGMGGDGTVVYYVVSEGDTKPRQN